jgi:uncharacterized membrane protein
MAQFEREQAHRHSMDKEAIRLDGVADRGARTIERESRWLGGALLAGCIAASIYLAMIDKDLVAVAMLGIPVMTAIGVLVQRHRQASKD